MKYESIEKDFDSTNDKHAKKNRDNKVRELKERGYSVTCSRGTTIRGANVYALSATKELEDEL